MICLHCGHCCRNYVVVIISDPAKGLDENNLEVHEGDGPCKHLLGDTPGEYMCAIHHYDWYKDTPCFAHTQIEATDQMPCRIGFYKLKK